ncbi:PRD domain-containing protein [Jeotgalibaca caeni]|uniref:PRD domain-containing protein n=1 Tax=Jeotgalibaca caeni TaxID=3028623 RepID=UPI00237D63E0|nr:PRD domain-containing protein [Jeotgalibaca caeni]MDE1548738.1 PRD domain-containing protein [Jeotgalibaca caeni]
MIQEKLTILLENDVIDELTYQYMQDTLQFLLKEDVIQTEDDADTFVTHLAMATMRQHREEEQIDSVEPFVKAEIIAAAEYGEAVRLWERIKEHIQVDFPENENDYFYLHLVTLLQTKQ